MGKDVVNWGDAVPIAERTEMDFQNRSVALGFNDTSGEIRSLLKGLTDETGLTATATADRAIRSYLAHLIDTEEIHDYREEYDVTVLLPPEGWIDPNSLPSPTPSEMIDANPTISVSVPPAVDSMIDDLSDRGQFETKAAFVKEAIRWYAGVKDGELIADDILPLTFLFETKARRQMIDFFLVDAPSDRALTKADIARETDLSRTSIVNHIEVLVEYGIVESEGEERPQYRPAVDKEPFAALIKTNEVLSERIRGG